MSAYFAGATLVPLYAVEAGESPALIGFLVSLTFLGPLILAIPIGRLIDRRGARPHMLIGALLLATMPIPVILAPSTLTIASFQIGYGLGQILLMLSGQSLAASIGSDKDRTRNFGWYTMAVSGGQLIGPLIAGIGAGLAGLHLGFAGCTVAALIGLAVVLVLRIRESESTTLYEKLAVRSEISHLWNNRTIQFAMAASSVVLLTLAVNQGLLPIILQERSATTVAAMFSLLGLASMATRPFLNRLSRGAPSNGFLLAAVVLIVAFGTLMIAGGSNLWTVATAMTLLGAGSGISQPLSMVMVLSEIERRHRGLALGFRITANRLAQLLGPALVGLIASLAGLTFAYVSVALLGPILVIVSRLRGGSRSSG